MSTPNPLVPQGTFQDAGKSHIRIAVFTILAIHVVLLSALLIAGCKRTVDEPAPPPPTDQTSLTPPPAPIEPPPLPTPAELATTPPPPTAETTMTPPPPPPLPVEVTAPPPPAPADTAVAPPPVTTTAPATEPGGSEHVITNRDTFAKLAVKYGVTVNAIKQANPNLNPNRLKVGDKVIIPAPAPKAPPTEAAAAPTTVGEGKTYKVKSGDTLTSIGRRFGVTPKQLRAANNLRTDQIRVGQALKIPTKGAPAPTN